MIWPSRAWESAPSTPRWPSCSASAQETWHYVTETDRVLLDVVQGIANKRDVDVAGLPAFNPGGPRRKLFFEPSEVTAAIVTCGGLCPGLNNVIRGLVLHLGRAYGVKRVLGFRNGFKGLADGSEPMTLTEQTVADIQNRGGTILGTSRGNQDPVVAVDTMVRLGVNILFVIGGDGTLRGAQKLADEARARAASASRWSGSRRRSTTTSRGSTAPSASTRPSRRPRSRSAPRT